MSGMSGLENTAFNLRFTAKQLKRQSARAEKTEKLEKDKVKKALLKGNHDIAKINAESAVRAETESKNLLRLASRIDAMASRVQSAVTMRKVTGLMINVDKGMEQAMKTMDLEKISAVMDRFETQFENLDVVTGYYENATASATAVATPQEDVDRLMSKVADEAGIELTKEMQSPETSTPVKVEAVKSGPTDVEEDALGERLRALRA